MLTDNDLEEYIPEHPCITEEGQPCHEWRLQVDPDGTIYAECLVCEEKSTDGKLIDDLITSQEWPE